MGCGRYVADGGTSVGDHSRHCRLIKWGGEIHVEAKSRVMSCLYYKDYVLRLPLLCAHAIAIRVLLPSQPSQLL